MFALLAAAHTINFGETYAVNDDPNHLKNTTAPCYGQPKDTNSTCTSYNAVLDTVGGSMVYSNTEQKVCPPDVFDVSHVFLIISTYLLSPIEINFLVLTFANI